MFVIFFSLLSVDKATSDGLSPYTSSSIENFGNVPIFLSNYFIFRGRFRRNFPEILDDIVARWARRLTLRAFGFVPVQPSVGSTAGLSIFFR